MMGVIHRTACKDVKRKDVLASMGGWGKKLALAGLVSKRHSPL
jgi:hypothetical protein